MGMGQGGAGMMGAGMGPGGMMGSMGGGRGMLMGGPGQLGGNQEIAAKKDLKTAWIELTKVGENTSLRLAEQVRPLRMAIIAASFPYKAQLEEFKDKLRLRSVDEVLAETSREIDPNGQALPAFRFLGVNVERAEVDANGKILKPYQLLDLKEQYRPFLILTGSRFEPDDPKFTPIKFYGLVMPRLLAMHRDKSSTTGQPGMLSPGEPGGPGGIGRPGRPGVPGGPGGPGGPGDMRGMMGSMMAGMGRGSFSPENAVVHEDVYPKVEEELKNITDTLKALEGKDPLKVAKVPTRFKPPDNFDPFDPTGGGAGAAGTVGPDMGPPGMQIGPGGLGKGGGVGVEGATPPGTTNPDSDIPEHCLIRLIDVTVEPGKIYQYRIQVRMANPNYNHKDVASPSYASDKELRSDRWFVIPQKVVVPPELIYYAVDQKELEGSKYKGPHSTQWVERGRQVALQAHKWLETVPTRDNKRNPLLVGEWSVAERILVFRGEYVGRPERVEFPLWKATQEDYVVATDSSTKVRHPGLEVSFGYDRPDGREMILVDFEGGKQSYDRVVSRAEDNVQKRKVDDSAALEVVMLSPDGRLLYRDSATDSENKQRKDRLERVRKRLEEVKDKGKSPDPAGRSNPFGGDGRGNPP
jgi:hypothetical protein